MSVEYQRTLGTQNLGTLNLAPTMSNHLDEDKEQPQQGDKAITFFNAGIENVVPYSGKILEPPNSIPIQILTTSSIGRMSSHIIEATETKSNLRRQPIHKEETCRAYQEALSISRTFVLADSFLSKDSILVDSSNFLKHGLEPLVQFYENGGRVIVVCREGIHDIGRQLNDRFGCQWSESNIDTGKCTPTEKARNLFGSEIPQELHAHKAYFFMSTPKDEQIYSFKPLSEEEYFTDNYGGFSSDEDLDEDEVNESRGDYSQYVQENYDSTLLALHKHESGGSLVWLGDPSDQEDTRMRAVFASICCGNHV